MTLRTTFALLASLALSAVHPATAQTLPPAERQLLLATTEKLLRERYVALAQRVQANRHSYLAIADGQALAQVMALRTLAAAPGTAPDWRGVLRGQLQEWAQNPPRLARQRFVLPGEAGGQHVVVAGSFNNWSSTATLLTRQSNAWVAEVEVAPGPLHYKFVVDGRWLLDPTNPRTEGAGDRANSVLDVSAK